MSSVHLMDTYKRLPVTFERGEGMYLWDTEGNKYLDGLAGIAVTGLGHANPVVTRAIQDQAANLLHTSNLYQIKNQNALADELARLTGLARTFFCNSGAEAIEAAIKLTRLYGHEKGIESPKIVVMTGAFHGRTMAAVTATANHKFQAGFDPLVPGFIRSTYNDIEALRALADKHNDIVAVMLEPVQGESGVNIPADDYLNEIRTLCNEKNWLMIVDEVQTGMGRTGSLFAYQSHQILPDIITVAKGLANGVAIGACLAQEKVANLFKPGSHGTTFGGNPLACAAGLATLKEIERLKIWENAKTQGTLLLNGLKENLKNIPQVKDVRGKGLMIGIELDRPCREILLLGLQERLLFSVANENTIRILPPLIINQEQSTQIIEVISKIIREFMK
jgi:acetylornithine/N-succinyldiaminopimelate aminotransferase